MKRLILLIAFAILMAECGTHRKISGLKDSPVPAGLSLPEETFIPLIENAQDGERDTVEISSPVNELIMNAVKDENGEMVATDVIRAAKVTARFRNIAERNGKVDLKFQITVPERLRDGKWQLQMDPDMYILGDSIRLDPVIITGALYRKRQLKGYEQYRKFLDSIVSDNGKFVNSSQLDIFIRRNIPQLYKFRNDSSFVSDEEFSSAYGVTEKAAIEHYTNKFRVQMNERKKARTGKVYARYVKAPIVKEGIRLDTVIVSDEGDFIYDYTQTISTCPGLKKAEIRLSGAIRENGEQILTIPRSEPLTFYISSLSSFADLSERYLTKVIARRAEANTVCYVDFQPGKAEIIPDLGNNAVEISRIRKNLRDIACDREYDLDSIVVTASASPEGKMAYNDRLSQMRAEAISVYFGKYLRHCQDSVRNDRGMMLEFDGQGRTERKVSVPAERQEVPFISRSAGENWKMLDFLVEADSTLNDAEKSEYKKIRETRDPDRRESLLAERASYRHLREALYPRLRTVRFDFHLHRKGMVLDTVRTTVLDTAYMSGVQAISDRDYRKAISILRPYADFNLAVAYCALDYNASALEILKDLERTDKVHYMLAILYSRTGRYKVAAEHYEQACSMNPTFIHRGNLDPEISSLIKMFGLNSE